MARRKSTEGKSVRPRKRRSSTPPTEPMLAPAVADGTIAPPAETNEPPPGDLPTVDEATRQLLAEPHAGSLALIRGIDWKTRLPHPAALLVGLGAGWQWSGLRTLVSSDLDPSPTTISMVAVVALIAAAVGPRIPARFVVSLARLIRNRREDGNGVEVDEVGSIWLLRAVRDRDEMLLWLSLAVLSSLAGVIGVLTLPLVSLFGDLHQQLLTHFFWTRMTLSAFEWTALAVITGGMWLMNGLLVAALSPVIGARTGSRREQPGIAGGVLLGLGVSLFVHDVLADRGLSGSQEMLLGALPMFSLSVLAATISQRAEARTPLSPPMETSAPELTGRAEGWIWISLAAWASGAALSASGWLDCESMASLQLMTTGFGLNAYLLTMGLGVAIASLTAAHEGRWTLDCGTVLWGAGVAAGLAAVMSAFLPWSESFSLLQLLVLALPLGYALHYVERAWLARAGSETLGFAQMTTALLAGTAIGLIVSRWWIAPALGPLGTLTTGGLVLMAFGGLSQIYEEDTTSTVQRRRLGLVFASLACAIVLFPTSTERWSHRFRPALPVRQPEVAGFLDTAVLERPGRLCIVGLPPNSTIPELDRWTGRIDWVLPENEWAIRSTAPNPQSRVLSMHDFRMLEMERTRYDLIYQCVATEQAASRFVAYSGEWFAALAARTSAAGRIIIDVPLAGHSATSIQIIVATLAYANHTDPLWCVIRATDVPQLRLMIAPETTVRSSAEENGRWRSADCLLDADVPPVPRHLVRRDRLTAVMQTASVDPRPVVDWLKARRQACAN